MPVFTTGGFFCLNLSFVSLIDDCEGTKTELALLLVDLGSILITIGVDTGLRTGVRTETGVQTGPYR